MREDLLLRNVGPEAAGVLVWYTVHADFADLFAVKEGRPGPLPDVEVDVGPDTQTYRCTAHGTTRSTTVTATRAGRLTRCGTFRVVVPARGEWSVCLSVRAVTSGRPVPPRYRCDDRVDDTVPAQRLRSWRLASPNLTTPDTGLATTLRVSGRDLGALQIHDPDHPERRVVAAGAPWFMALFGRDSLLTSWV